MDKQLNIDKMKLLNEKINMTSSIKPFDWQQASGHPSSDAGRVKMPASTTLRISHSANEINNENT